MKINGKELDQILAEHKAWLNNDKDGVRANLDRANLDRASLWSCSGNRQEVKSLFVSEKYAITYTAKHLQIGCEKHEIADWWGFDNDRIKQMGGNSALTFWKEWKDTIWMIIDKSPAKETGYKSE